MSGFLYFIPQEDRAIPSEEQISRLGLIDRVGGRGTNYQPSVTMGETLGCIATHRSCNPHKSVVVRQCQYWSPLWGGASIGYWIDDPPRERELRRHHHVGGEWIVLGDGQQWLIPSMFRYGLGYIKPTPTPPDWDDLAQDIDRLHKYAVASTLPSVHVQADPVPYEDQKRIIAQCLGTCYRVGPGEVEVLGLLTDENVPLCLGALFDFTNVCIDIARLSALTQDVPEEAAING